MAADYRSPKSYQPNTHDTAGNKYGELKPRQFRGDGVEEVPGTLTPIGPLKWKEQITQDELRKRVTKMTTIDPAVPDTYIPTDPNLHNTPVNESDLLTSVPDEPESTKPYLVDEDKGRFYSDQQIERIKREERLDELKAIIADEDRHDDSPMVRGYIQRRIAELKAKEVKDE